MLRIRSWISIGVYMSNFVQNAYYLSMTILQSLGSFSHFSHNYFCKQITMLDIEYYVCHHSWCRKWRSKLFCYIQLNVFYAQNSTSSDGNVEAARSSDGGGGVHRGIRDRLCECGRLRRPDSTHYGYGIQGTLVRNWFKFVMSMIRCLMVVYGLLIEEVFSPTFSSKIILVYETLAYVI